MSHEKHIQISVEQEAAARAITDRMEAEVVTRGTIIGMSYSAPRKKYGAGTDAIAALIAERDALAKFKAYVHQRLDEAGVPADPDSPHKAEGCRIGGRLDWVLAECSAMQLERESLARLIAANDGRFPPSPAPAKEPA